jgi:hypothetical protein
MLYPAELRARSGMKEFYAALSNRTILIEDKTEAACGSGSI